LGTEPKKKTDAKKEDEEKKTTPAPKKKPEEEKKITAVKPNTANPATTEASEHKDQSTKSGIKTPAAKKDKALDAVKKAEAK
jgi:hypothetical protein